MSYNKEELMSKFNDFLNENLEDSKDKKFSLSEVDNDIRLMESINNILSKEGTNESLVCFVSQYKNALNDGCREEMLYETFTQGLGQFGYLRAVDTELSALKDRIGKAKQNIDLTKILEMMNNTTSYYIVPLIESDVISYMKEKTPNKRSLLIHHLNTFQHDPYVRQIINCVNLDNELAGLMVRESKEFVSANAYTSKVYSPVQFIRENECAFNVNNSFYIKKGNHISKMNKDQIASLNESFINICRLVNDPRVFISEEQISFYHKNDVIKINESGAYINGSNSPESVESLRRLNEMYVKYDNYDSELYLTAAALMESFDKIAEIPFVKHIALNENEGLSVDLFKVKGNIFITTHNDMMKQHSFYRNVNPIQCASIINEHLETNVSNLFEDLMPNQDKIKKEIDETKEAYEERLSALKEKKEELKSVLDEADDKKSIESALDDIEKDIKATEDEYKEWQDKADGLLNKEADDEEKLSDEFNDDEEDSEKNDIISIERENSDNLEEPITPEGDLSIEPEGDFAIGFEEELPIDQEFSAEPASQEDPNRYQIVRIDFAENVKTGERSNTGNVIVILPVVDSDGNLISETSTIRFYIDNEGKVILNNSGMSADMYLDIIARIENDPRMQEINSSSYGASSEGEWNDPMESKEEIVIGAAPKMNRTGIARWVPESDEALQEALLIEGIAGEYSINESVVFANKTGVLNESYDNVLNSALDTSDFDKEDDIEDEEDSAEDFLEDEDERTTLEKVREAAANYIDEIEDVEGNVDDEIFVEECNFGDVPSFKFEVNGNVWAFFEFGDKIYTIQYDAFDNALENCNSVEEFESFLSDNEEIESAKKEERLSKVMELLTSIISVETGDNYSFVEEDEDDEINEGIKVKLKKGKKKSSEDLLDFSGETIEKEEAEEGSENEKESDDKVEDAKDDDKEDEESEEDTSAEEVEESEDTSKKELPKIRIHKVNESATGLLPQPNDSVLFKGKPGTIQSVNPDGTLTILMNEGITVDCSPREVKITTDRKDVVPVPFKYDPKTLAALCEQYVSCGIFQSGVRVTAENCVVNYAEWERKKDHQNVTVINEGSRILIPKKNVRILEDVNSFANIEDYIEGVHIVNGQAIDNILINALDYAETIAGNDPVRCLVRNGGEPKFVQLPKDSVRTLAV